MTHGLLRSILFNSLIFGDFPHLSVIFSSLLLLKTQNILLYLAGFLLQPTIWSILLTVSCAFEKNAIFWWLGDNSMHANKVSWLIVFRLYIWIIYCLLVLQITERRLKFPCIIVDLFLFSVLSVQFYQFLLYIFWHSVFRSIHI